MRTPSGGDAETCARSLLSGGRRPARAFSGGNRPFHEDSAETGDFRRRESGGWRRRRGRDSNRRAGYPARRFRGAASIPPGAAAATSRCTASRCAPGGVRRARRARRHDDSQPDLRVFSWSLFVVFVCFVSFEPPAVGAVSATLHGVTMRLRRSTKNTTRTKTRRRAPRPEGLFVVSLRDLRVLCELRAAGRRRGQRHAARRHDAPPAEHEHTTTGTKA